MAERALAMRPLAVAGSRPGAVTLLLRMVRQRRIIGLGGAILLVMLGVAIAAPASRRTTPWTSRRRSACAGPRRRIRSGRTSSAATS